MKNKNGAGKYQEQIVKQLYKAIIEKHPIEFYYIDKYKKKEGTRKGEAYLMGINEKGNLFVSGVFTTIKENNEEKGSHKNYLIDQIKEGSLKILPEKFNHLRIEPEKVYRLKEANVLCAVYLPEEIRSAFSQ